MTRRPRFQYRTTLVSALAGMLIVLSLRSSVFASPISSGTLQSGAEVYQGLVAVSPGTAGANLMELGLSGSTIASTGDLYLRPNALTGGNGVRLENVGGKTRLHAIGGVCLGGTCLDKWPDGGAGTSYWQLSGGRVTPLVATNSLLFDKPDWSQPYQGLDLNGKSGAATLSIGNTSTSPNASAASFGGELGLWGQVDLNSRAGGDEIVLRKNYCDSNRTDAGQNTSPYEGEQCNPTGGCEYGGGNCFCQSGGFAPQATCKTKNYKVWHAGNDGHTTQKYCVGGPTDGVTCDNDAQCGFGGICTWTGLDATYIDGNEMQFKRYPNSSGIVCSNSAPFDPVQDYRCLCVTFDYDSNPEHCIQLSP